MNIGSRTFELSHRDGGTYLFYGSLFVLFVTVTEILDIFELPFESLVTRLFASGSLVSLGFVTSSLVALGYLGVFVLMALESASLPIPSEVVLPFAGYLVSRGSLSFTGVVAASTGAGVLGALIDYYLALKLGRPIVERLFRLSGAKPENLNQTERWIGTKGSWGVLAARFIPGVRSVISLPAGAFRMRLRAFVSMTLVGAFGWSVLLVYIGYSAGNLWQTALTQYSPLLTNLLLSAGAVASCLYISYYLVSKRFPRIRKS